MPEKPSQERTELATSRKREQSRKKGQVARSQDLSSFMIIAAGAAALVLLAPAQMVRLQGLLHSGLSFEGAANVTAGNFNPFGQLYVTEGMRLILPFWGLLLVVGLISGVSQVGFKVNWGLLEAKPDRISPIGGFKRIFSKRSAFELIKSLTKTAVLIVITWVTLRGETELLLGLGALDLGPALALLGQVALKLAARLIVLLIVLAIADFAFQRWQHEKEIMMTKQEMKEELKEQEGDPLMRSRIRALQRDMSTRRMMEDVKQADVVVTNPTTYAVALRYEENAAAPTMLAKGQRKMAERIKALAREHGISVVENKPLARALFAEVEMGESIPIKFYQAVAELLAYVYRLQGREPHGGSE